MEETNGRAAPGGGRLRVSLARGRAPLKEEPLGTGDIGPAGAEQQQPQRRSYQPSGYASNRPARTNQDGAPSPAKDPREEREERDARTKEILAAGSWRRR